MKLNLKTITFLFTVLILLTITTSIFAATESELLSYLKQAHTVSGTSIKLDAANLVKIERYLQENDVTAAQADTVIAKVEAVKAIMTKQGVTSVSKLTEKNKTDVINLAKDAATTLDLTLSVDSNVVNVYDKTGKLIDSASISSKLAYTGNTLNSYLLIGFSVVVAIAIYFISKKEFVKNEI